MFLRIFKHLLPDARAWRITASKTIRDFFSGLTDLGSNSKLYYDELFLDVDPETTRELSTWEDQFALYPTVFTVAQRRERLAATWKAIGGQDPRYIQDTLQAAGFDVYVHEWWEPIGGVSRTNLIYYSQSFANTYWVKDGTIVPTIDSNVAVAPNGTPTADRCNFGADSYSRLKVTVSGNTTPGDEYTCSIYARTETGTEKYYLQVWDDVSGGSYILCTVGTSWQRFDLQHLFDAASTVRTVEIWNFDATARSVLIWGAQLEIGSEATEIITTNGSAKTVTSATRPCGGSINADVTPVARNPFDYLYDGVTPAPYLMQDGASDIGEDGDALAMDGYSTTPRGYPLVNKIPEATEILNAYCDGSEEMQDGGLYASDGSLLVSFGQKQYIIPNDATKYPYFLYIGAETFPDRVSVEESRKEEFEDMCLKICPLEQWLGILVDYN